MFRTTRRIYEVVAKNTQHFLIGLVDISAKPGSAAYVGKLCLSSVEEYFRSNATP